MLLLDRDSFRAAVFARDNYRCVICGNSAPIDAHHIMERRLWDICGGYYLDNGATLCDDHGDTTGCHRLAERTTLTCEAIRQAAGIKHVLLPEHLYPDAIYDKWANIINPDGTRTRGELFQDESVQKVLTEGGVLHLFRNHVKYPRTYHLPWSPGSTDDDRVMQDTSCFNGRRVVITEKMDGENSSIYADHYHARSLDSGSHPSRGWLKNLHANVAASIPVSWRLCGENLFAEHTLHYDNLPSYFMVFSIWDDSNNCLSWDDTVLYSKILELETVPLLYDGIWNEEACRKLSDSMDLTKREGYVVRLADGFPFAAFRRSVAKFVRASHVGTGHNWMQKTVVRNGLAKIVKVEP